MKKLLSIIFIAAVLIGVAYLVTDYVGAENVEVETTISEEYIPSEETKPIVEVPMTIIQSEPEFSVEVLREKMDEQLAIKEKAHEKANELRAEGYTEDSDEIQEQKSIYMKAHETYLKLNEEYREKWINSDEFWAQKEAENPTGTYVWRYLKNLGYSDAVCAGIFGNMMLECGIEEAGGFDLKWWKYDRSHWFYGICQWSKTYFPEVYGADLDGQLECLKNTIQEQIDEAGFAYGGTGFGYEEFLQLEDCREVAVCFARAYERCAPQHVWPRRGFAEEAYNYFTN